MSSQIVGMTRKCKAREVSSSRFIFVFALSKFRGPDQLLQNLRPTQYCYYYYHLQLLNRAFCKGFSLTLPRPWTSSTFLKMEVPRSSEIFRILIFCKLPLNNYVELSRRLAWYLSNFAFAPQSLNSTLCISSQNPGIFFPVFLFLCVVSSRFFLSLSLFGIVIIITISIIIFITITIIIIIIIIIIMNNTTAVVVTLVALKKIPSFAKL